MSSPHAALALAAAAASALSLPAGGPITAPPPNVLWQVPCDTGADQFHQPVIIGGTVYVVSGLNLLAIEVLSGKVRYNTTIAHTDYVLNPAAYDAQGGRLFLATMKAGGPSAYAMGNGSLLWDGADGGTGFQDPLDGEMAYRDGTLYYLGDFWRGFDARTGASLFVQHDMPSQFYGDSFTMLDASMVIGNQNPGCMLQAFGLALTRGAPSWQYLWGNDDLDCSYYGLAFDGHTLYQGAQLNRFNTEEFNNSVIAVSPLSGAQVGLVTVETGSDAGIGPVLLGSVPGALLVGTWPPGPTQAFDVHRVGTDASGATGAVAKLVSLDEQHAAPPTLDAARNRFLVALLSGQLCSYRADSGTQLWCHQVDALRRSAYTRELSIITDSGVYLTLVSKVDQWGTPVSTQLVAVQLPGAPVAPTPQPPPAQYACAGGVCVVVTVGGVTKAQCEAKCGHTPRRS